MHNFRTPIFVILALFSFNCHAGDPVVKLYGTKWFYIEHDGGLTSVLPATNTLELLYQVQQLRNTKLARQTELNKTLEESRFGIKDALISAIVPGGLMYATMKNMELKRAESKLENVSIELVQLNKDLEMLTSTVSENMLSMLYLP